MGGDMEGAACGRQGCGMNAHAYACGRDRSHAGSLTATRSTASGALPFATAQGGAARKPRHAARRETSVQRVYIRFFLRVRVVLLKSRNPKVISAAPSPNPNQRFLAKALAIATASVTGPHQRVPC